MQFRFNAIKQWYREGLSLLVTFLLVVGASYVVFFDNPQPVSGLSEIDRQKLATNQQASSQDMASFTTPTRLLLPTIDVAIDIVDSSIDVKTNTWPLSDTQVHFANFTPKLGNTRGTLLLYGHNTPAVLSATANLSIGDEMVLVDEKGISWKFTLEREENITPDQVGFIYEDVPFRVVMFTCAGWGDQYRRLMYFAPVK